MKIIPANNYPDFYFHKAVYELVDEKAGLKAFIAIHNDNLGAAVGGTRMFPYASDDEAISDVLRLSHSMSYKCALAGVNFGGGKAVIIGNPKLDKTPELLTSYAKGIDELRGAFYTGEDVGISESDVQQMLKTSPYFIGKSSFAGDPSPYASLSTFYAIEKIAQLVWGNDDLSGKTVAVKGVGKVGSELVRLLSEKDAQVIIADLDPEAIKATLSVCPNARVVDSKEIAYLDVDIYAPCAMGNEFNKENLSSLKCKIICGAANNQLSDSSMALKLYKNGITFVPDYVANAGGLINVADELETGGYNKERVLQRISNIKNTIQNLWDLSRYQGKSMHEVADQLAEKIINK